MASFVHTSDVARDYPGRGVVEPGATVEADANPDPVFFAPAPDAAPPAPPVPDTAPADAGTPKE